MKTGVYFIEALNLVTNRRKSTILGGCIFFYDMLTYNWFDFFGQNQI